MGVKLNSAAGRAVLKALGESPAALVAVAVPPSTNNLFATVRGRRVKTRAYKEWLAVAAVELARLGAYTAGPCRLVYTLVGDTGLNRARDLGNIEKPVTDALVAANVIPDDCLRHVHEIELRYRPGSACVPRVEVRVEPAAGPGGGRR